MDEFLKLLAGLVSVVNPIGAIPIFISLTENRSLEQRRHIAFVCSFSVCIVLLTALFGGEIVLGTFGIGIPSFRVAGGILILLMAISMLTASHDRSKHTPEEHAEAYEKESVAVVPLAIPLLSGPGAISTTIVYAHMDHVWTHYLLVSGVIFTVSFLILLALLAAPQIISGIGQIGMNIVTRVMGLIIASIAVEFIAKGMTALFPILGGPQ